MFFYIFSESVIVGYFGLQPFLTNIISFLAENCESLNSVVRSDSLKFERSSTSRAYVELLAILFQL